VHRQHLISHFAPFLCRESLNKYIAWFKVISLWRDTTVKVIYVKFDHRSDLYTSATALQKYFLFLSYRSTY